MIVIETPRLQLREMTPADRQALCRSLQDSEVMYAYNGPFSDEEVDEWLERQLARYRQYGYGLWAVVLKATGEMIGQCGLTLQQWNGRAPTGIRATPRRPPAPAWTTPSAP